MILHTTTADEGDTKHATVCLRVFFLPHEGGGQVDGRLMDGRVKKNLNISIYIYVQKSRVNKKKNKATDRQALIYFRLR